MSNDVVQAEYEQLDRIAERFGRWSQANADLKRQVDQAATALMEGGWQGQGIDAFSAEMEGKVFPAMLRLTAALDEAQKTTQQISALLKAAEEEAAQPFHRNDWLAYGTSTNGQSSNGVGSGLQQRVASGGGGAESLWSKFQLKGEGDIWQFDRAADSGSRSNFDPGIGIKYGVEDAVFGDTSSDGFSALGGEVGAQAGIGKEGVNFGVYGEGYAGQGRADGVLGDRDLGLTGEIEGRVLAAEGFAGIRNNSIGASIGGSLVSVEGAVGTNVAGYNVGLKGGIGLKAELGFKIGQETEIKLPFFTIGFKFGKAVE